MGFAAFRYTQGMSQRFRPLPSWLIVLLYIGILPPALNAAEEEPDAETLIQKHLVYVEQASVIVSKVDGEYKLQSYRERRTHWGLLIGVDYDAYEPLNYQPNFSIENYRRVYGVPQSPTLELQVAVKRNFSFGSIGIEVAGSFFSNTNSDPALVNSSLSLNPIRVGGSVYLDTLWAEPYVVPYASAGAYTMIYHERLAGNSFNGNTQVAPYINAGCAYQIDWIDKRAARTSHEESHMQSTYVYTDARKYFTSQGKKDPDVGNDVSWAAGLRVEF